MRFIGRLFGLGPDVKFSFAQAVGLGKVKWMNRDAREYAKEGYQKNVVAFRCVQLIARAAGSLPLLVKIGDQDAPDNHPLRLLLNRPNPMQGGATFIEGVVGFRLITGNTYIERLGPDGKPPKELWTWTPYEMKVVASDAHGLPAGYVWTKDQETQTWEADAISGQSDILHWKTFHPTNQWYGLSPLEAAAYAIDQHNMAGEWNMRMLQNSAEPSGVLSTDQTISEPKFKQLLERMKRQTGPRNARKAMILEGGLKWQQTALSPRDMDWSKGKELSAQDIASTYGVPLQLIPIPGSQTFANYEQARGALYEDEVLPLMDNLLDELNNWLSPQYGDRVKLSIDIDAVPALEPRRKERWVAVQAADWLTPNEKREATGYESFDHPLMDVPWLASGKLPLEEEVDDEEEELADEAARAARRDAGEEEEEEEEEEEDDK
jgi:HK97 family phage portal protein